MEAVGDLAAAARSRLLLVQRRFSNFWPASAVADQHPPFPAIPERFFIARGLYLEKEKNIFIVLKTKRKYVGKKIKGPDGRKILPQKTIFARLVFFSPQKKPFHICSHSNFKNFPVLHS